MATKIISQQSQCFVKKALVVATSILIVRLVRGAAGGVGQAQAQRGQLPPKAAGVGGRVGGQRGAQARGSGSTRKSGARREAASHPSEVKSSRGQSGHTVVVVYGGMMHTLS
jgi:hypothetical protein